MAALLVTGLLGNALQTTAQTTKLRIPIISLGRIKPPEIKDGKPIPTPTTRQAILKNALLLADLNNCRVVAYKFALIAPGQGYYGPVYVDGGELTDSLKSKIKATPGPNVKIYIEDVRMLYRGDTMNGNNVYLQYDQ